MNILVMQNETPFFEYAIPGDEILEGTELFIGRSDDCHIVLEDQKISRYHAKVIVKNDGIYIKNNSEFGQILVNGKVIDEIKIPESARVAIDDYILQFSHVDHDGVQSFQRPKLSSLSSYTENFNQETEVIARPEEKYEEFGLSNSIEDEPLEDDLSDLEQTDINEDVNMNASSDTEADFESYLDSDSGPDNMDEKNNDPGPIPASEGEDFNNGEFTEGDVGDFEDEGFEGGFGDDEVGGKTQVFQSFAKFYLILNGEFAPFDRYEIGSDPVSIGRDPEKCQICLSDSEVSSVHATITKNFISCVIQDLNSSNGTKLNGERINKAELINGDIFEIGSTRFKVEVKSDLIESEKDVLMPVDTNQEIEVEEILEEEVDFDDLEEAGSAEVQEKSIIKRIMKDPKKKKIAYILIGLVVFSLLFGDEEEKPLKDEGKKEIIVKADDKKVEAEKETKDLSPEVLEKLEQNYQLALAKYEVNEFNEAKTYLEIVVSIDPNYKNTQTLQKLIKQAMEEISRIKKEEQEEIERRKRQLEVQKLIAKAKDAVKEREVRVAESLFGQILEKDPENIDVPQLKLEIDAYKQEKEQKKLEEEAAKAKRRRMVESLAPGKTLYMRGDWYKAIVELESFSALKGIDEDIMEEGIKMLRESQTNLKEIVDPLLGQARSYKEGEDLKRAYETYGEILKHDPGNEEALNEREEIKTVLDTRSRKVYREALISESLSLFNEAKEKYQEVQQISPVGSEYYRKATDKLKDYLE